MFSLWLCASVLDIHMFVSLLWLIAEIWDALRAAAEADISLAQTIVDSAGVIVQNNDLTTCYDERGQTFTCLSDFSWCFLFVAYS